jgi:hypothetical protein
MANNTPYNSQNNKNGLAINADIEPYHRCWNNNGMHMLGNRIGGAFGTTKKEWHKMIETRNRINKQRKLKQKSK